MWLERRGGLNGESLGQICQDGVTAGTSCSPSRPEMKSLALSAWLFLKTHGRIIREFSKAGHTTTLSSEQGGGHRHQASPRRAQGQEVTAEGEMSERDEQRPAGPRLQLA